MTIFFVATMHNIDLTNVLAGQHLAVGDNLLHAVRDRMCWLDTDLTTQPTIGEATVAK